MSMHTQLAVFMLIIHLCENTLVSHLSTIAQELQFDGKDKDMYLGGVFHLAYYASGATLSVIQTYLLSAMRVQVSTIMLCCTAGLSVACYCTASFTSYSQLLVSRCCVGALLATAEPFILTAYLSNARVHQRPEKASAVSIAAGTGVLLGHILSGMWLQWKYSHRSLSMLLSALYALVFGLCISKKFIESRDYSQTYHEYRTPVNTMLCCTNFYDHIDKLRRVKSAALVCVQGFFGCIPLSVFTAYITDFLLVEVRMQPGSVNACILIFGLASAVGILVGSSCGARLRKRLMHEEVFSITALMCWCSVLPCAVIFNMTSTVNCSPALMHTCVAAAGVLSNFSGGNLRAAIVDLSSSHHKSFNMSVFNASNAMGRAIGPMLIPLMTVFLNVNRSRALSTVLVSWIVSGFCIYRARTCLLADMRRLHKETVIHTQGS